ncbi:MAG TPA: protealysin inhibitor emfourin [Acidimicrobiales bacterium]|nr:protealysin inhibitor emfourin [Acidimicrobiales bacterium]
MKVTVEQGGGMVPVVITTVADAAALSAADAATLRAMVDDAGLLALASSAGEAHPDRPSYHLVVEHEGGRHEVAFDDASIPDAVRSLVSWVSSVPGHEEHVGPPG